MLVDTRLTIAYKCASCGTFEFFSIYLFELINGKRLTFQCHCRSSSVNIYALNQNDFKIDIPCIACGETHTHNLTRKLFTGRQLCVLCCPNTSMTQCILGRDEDVRSKIDSLERELDDIINLFGYDNYFTNTQVMFDALNRIHDIAEQGNLFCECGTFDIDLVLLPDKILLKCKECSGIRLMSAASNDDLKKILKISNILLSAEYISALDEETLNLIGEPVVKK